MSEAEYNQEQIDKYERRARAAQPHQLALGIIVFLMVPLIIFMPEQYRSLLVTGQLVALGIQLSFAAFVIYSYQQASKWIDRDIERMEREIGMTITKIESDKENQ
ncbi:hypothetical protein [Rhodococcus sp. HS-D2]|uniref:hypothetical protein n=1 Tax=Rhodococcus sp. HS-D2 TaxID=1384636 RepID=UPI0007D944B4|nr:hypothetical protein [Rhodococcus sp. HS-D2]